MALKRNLKIYITVAYIFGMLSVPSVIFSAQDPNCDPTQAICNQISQFTIPGFIQAILTGVLKIGIPIVALAIIYCGFLFVAARGKPEAITKAKSALLYTLIGAAILLGSWALAELISSTVLSL